MAHQSIGGWGLYPWFEESGTAKVHPDDLEAFRALAPGCRVFEVVEEAAPFVVLAYGNGRYRVLPVLFQAVQPPSFRIDDRVSVEGRYRGTIRDILWHHKRAEHMFFLNVGGRRKSRRYWVHELSRVEESAGTGVEAPEVTDASWKEVIARYRNWQSDAPRVAPLRQIAETLGASPLAAELQAGTSMYALVISAINGPLNFTREPCVAVRVAPRPGEVRLQFIRRPYGGPIVERTCRVADAWDALQPLLNRVRNETSMKLRKRPR